jgi:hypothetical protein
VTKLESQCTALISKIVPGASMKVEQGKELVVLTVSRNGRSASWSSNPLPDAVLLAEISDWLPVVQGAWK